LSLAQETPPVRFIRKCRPEKNRITQFCHVEEIKTKITISSLNLELSSGLTAALDLVDNYDLMFEYLTLNDR
jgi:hypothetical protein